jgi:hypothetical protein
MSAAPDPYVHTNPGDLITAQLFNGVQSTIKQDIAEKIGKAVSEIKAVEHADDATKLGGKTVNELEEEIIQKALAILPTRTGYKMVFKRLTKDDEKVIKHDLKAFPLVDVYQLDYFNVVCARSEEREDQSEALVNFYLYHSSEKRLRTPPPPRNIDIELTDGKHHPFKIPFAAMLDLAGVKYSDTQSLGDLEIEFWDAFFALPNNDQFDPDQYCHSPWFERCCGEQRSVATLKQRGDWDEIWFQMRPRKAVNVPPVSPAPSPPPPPIPAPGATNYVQVVQFDFDTIGVQLLQDPVYPTDLTPAISNTKELKVMLLLKV